MATASVVQDMRNTRNAEVLTLSPHPVTRRLIDSHPGVRTRPMQVLVLGASRTGTVSIMAALEQLGYNPYHMAKGKQRRTVQTASIAHPKALTPLTQQQ
jgi:hypothetical protein